MDTKIKMQFDPQVAKDIGVEEAIMYSNIEFWVAHNEANERNSHDGHYWTYNSMTAFQSLFPFWTVRQIERILRKLKNAGYIKTGNYNTHKYDKTNWYTTLHANGGMESLKSVNAITQKRKPIPDAVNQIINTNTSSNEEEQAQVTFGNDDINWVFTEFEQQFDYKSQGTAKQDRFMARHLLKNFTREQITAMMRFCNTGKYPPRVGSVEKLWYKRGDIIAGLKTLKESHKVKIAFIS